MDPSARATDVRQLQIIWGAIVGGVALMVLVLGGLALSGEHEVAGASAALLFYATAAVNIGAVVAAFWVQHRLAERLSRGGTYQEAMAAIRTSGLVSIAIMEGAALIAAVVAFVTGQLITLLFVLPFFGFAALFFPTAARVQHLLGRSRRG